MGEACPDPAALAASKTELLPPKQSWCPISKGQRGTWEEDFPLLNQKTAVISGDFAVHSEKQVLKASALKLFAPVPEGQTLSWAATHK